MCTYDNHMPTHKWHPISSISTHTAASVIRGDGFRGGRKQCGSVGKDGDLWPRVLWLCYHALPISLSYTHCLWGSRPIHRVVLALGKKKKSMTYSLGQSRKCCDGSHRSRRWRGKWNKRMPYQGMGYNYACGKVCSISRLLGSDRG